MNQNLFPIFCILLCLNTAFAQQKQTLQAGQKTVDVLPDLIDTLYIKAGKPYLFLINVADGDVQLFGDDQEEAEVRANFKENALQIVKINQHLLLLFENQKSLDLRNTDNAYQLFAYWSGNMAQDVLTQEGTHMATEFAAAQIGVKKESSYVVNGRKYRAEVSVLNLSNNITQKSKLVMNELLYEATSVLPKDRGEFGDLFKIKNQKIKTTNTFLTRKGKRALLKSLTLNEIGQPVEIRFFSNSGSGKERGSTRFLYEKTMLSEVIESDSIVTKVFYDDEKIILVKTTEESTKTEIYYLENGELLQKTYYISPDNTLWGNSYQEVKMTNNCKNRYIDGRLYQKDCESSKGVFPYFHTNTSYEDDGSVRQLRGSKMEQKDAKNYQLYFSETKSEGEKEDYRLSGTVHLNKLGLVESLKVMEKQKQGTIDIEYSFY